jgi:DNA-binding NarL/FixJ family response regulator
MGIRVLIVDDLEPFRDAAREVIAASDGFEAVGEADSGEEAVLAAGRLEPDLVLMDVNLPGIDGMEATRRILAERRRTVVVLLSTFSPAEFAPLVAQCGAADYIPKSKFDPDRLAQAWVEAAAAAR